MKKTKLAKLFGSAALAALLSSMPTVANAVIAGFCSDCHTMHGSIGGSPITTPSGLPLPSLLRADCVGCHADGGTEKIIMLGTSPSPQVYHTASDDLAGGNFAYIDGVKGTGASDRKGHNAYDVVTSDALLSSAPGWEHTGRYLWYPPNTIGCAGVKGCHGVRNQYVSEAYIDPDTGELVEEVPRVGLDAMKKTHHYNVDGQIDVADTAANSYRFLLGLKGLENPDIDHPWENFDANSHNEYYGVSNVNFSGVCGSCHVNGTGPTTTTYMKTPNNSMSGFCGTCHSKFHSTGPAGKTGFLRHPSDFTLPDKTEYSAYTTYDLTAPVARDSVVATSSSTVTPGSDIVMCLSCHVAHGSDNEGMLRFDYEDMIAGGGTNSTGCFVCHSTKDTNTP
jgi:predicted CXXCH cytochrome family protein